MKDVILLFVCILASLGLMAQTFSEWFRQNSTQLKYLQEQIGALQAYMATLEDGYRIVRDGLGTIDVINQADFDLHSGQCNYLKHVSPGILSNPGVVEIRSCFVLLNLLADSIARESALQPAGQVDWPVMGAGIARKINQIIVASEQRLAAVLATGVLEMSDAERADVIMDIYTGLYGQVKKAGYLLEALKVNSIKPRS